MLPSFALGAAPLGRTGSSASWLFGLRCFLRYLDSVFGHHALEDLQPALAVRLWLSLESSHRRFPVQTGQ